MSNQFGVDYIKRQRNGGLTLYLVSYLLWVTTRGIVSANTPQQKLIEFIISILGRTRETNQSLYRAFSPKNVAIAWWSFYCYVRHSLLLLAALFSCLTVSWVPFSPLSDPCLSLSINIVGWVMVMLNEKVEKITVCIGGQTHFCFILRNMRLYRSKLEICVGSKDTSMHNMHVNDFVTFLILLLVFAETETVGVWIMGWLKLGGFPGKLEIRWSLIFFFHWETEEVGSNDASLDDYKFEVLIPGWTEFLSIYAILPSQKQQFESENGSFTVGLGCTCCPLHRDDPSVYLLRFVSSTLRKSKWLVCFTSSLHPILDSLVSRRVQWKAHHLGIFRLGSVRMACFSAHNWSNIWANRRQNQKGFFA